MTTDTKDALKSIIEFIALPIESLRDISKNLKRIADSMELANVQVRPTILDIEEKPYHSPFQQVPSGFISNIEIKPEPPYDWWRLQNGDYAKVYKIELKGTIYKEDGTMVTNFSPIWNPYNLRNINLVNDSRWDLKNRKSSVEDKGWPEWTK